MPKQTVDFRGFPDPHFFKSGSALYGGTCMNWMPPASCLCADTWTRIYAAISYTISGPTLTADIVIITYLFKRYLQTSFVIKLKKKKNK